MQSIERKSRQMSSGKAIRMENFPFSLANEIQWTLNLSHFIVSMLPEQESHMRRDSEHPPAHSRERWRC